MPWLGDPLALVTLSVLDHASQPALACRFWRRLISHVHGLTPSDLVHRSLPSGSGFSCFAPLASPMPPGVSRWPEGGTLSRSPLGWELDKCPHPLAHQGITGQRFTCASHPLGYPQVSGERVPAPSEPDVTGSRHTAQALHSPLAGAGHAISSAWPPRVAGADDAPTGVGVGSCPSRARRDSHPSIPGVIGPPPARGARPVGRLLPVGPGQVPTRIHPVTGWPSLLPTSSTRTPLGLPYGARSQREMDGVPTFRFLRLSGEVPGPRCRT